MFRSVSKICFMSFVLAGASGVALAQDGQAIVERIELDNRAKAQRELALLRQERSDLDMSIFTRKHTDYDSLNVRVGDFVFIPSLTASLSYLDNVYETSSNKINDVLYKTVADIKAKSDFLHHQLEASLFAEDGMYKDTGDEDYTDYTVYIGGRADLTEQIQIPVGVTYAREHSKRDSPDDRDGAKPTEYDVLTLQSGMRYVGYLFDTSFETSVSKYSYQDNVNSSGVFIYNGDRNRTELSNSLTLGFAESGKLAPFVYGGVKNVSYDDAVDDFGIDRNSHGWEAGIGTRVHLTGVTRSTLNVGTIHREFDDATLSTIDTMVFGLDVEWEPSSLAGVTVSAKRYVDEAALADTSASINSSVGVEVTYEISSNIYLKPEAQYLIKDYQSSDDRKIDRAEVGADLVYKLNRNVWTTFSYNYSIQNEEINSTSSTEVDANTVMVSIKFQL